MRNYRKPTCTCTTQATYCIVGKFSGGKFGELTRFEHLAKESLAN